MAYKIIWSKLILILYMLRDFPEKSKEIVIDCRTEEGQIKFIELFGYFKFRRLARYYKTDILVFKNNNDIFVNKSLIETLFQNLNERTRRLVAAFLFIAFPKETLKDFSFTLKMNVKTIKKGIKELISNSILSKNKIRNDGSGRKTKDEEYMDFLETLEKIAQDHMAGDPMTTKKWIRHSLKYFKDRLQELGMKVSPPVIRKAFKKIDISLKSNKKSLNRTEDKRRESQFQHINATRSAFLAAHKPVISIDTKKKEPIGLFKTPGRQWKKEYTEVLDHDFPNLRDTLAVPFGIYDIGQNQGFVYVGTSHETSQFLVTNLVSWWQEIGQKLYPNAKELLINCDAGGANGSRRKGWKYELFKEFSEKFGIKITVCHYPPGASKYNPIERKLFSFISINWAGEPLESIDTLINLIQSTATKEGLSVKAFLNENDYPTGIKYTKEQMAEIKIRPFPINPQLNYTIFPDKTTFLHDVRFKLKTIYPSFIH